MALARSVAIIAVISLGTYVYHQMSVTASAPYHAFTSPSSIETMPHAFDYASPTMKEPIAKEPLSSAQLIVEWLANQDAHTADTQTVQPLQLRQATPPLATPQPVATITSATEEDENKLYLRKFNRSTLASPSSSSEFPPLATPNATARAAAAPTTPITPMLAPKLPPPPVLSGAARPYLKVTPLDMKAFTYHVMVR
jgi:hypothetical protein